jgi:hypothetical protein
LIPFLKKKQTFIPFFNIFKLFALKLHQFLVPQVQRPNLSNGGHLHGDQRPVCARRREQVRRLGVPLEGVEASRGRARQSDALQWEGLERDLMFNYQLKNNKTPRKGGNQEKSTFFSKSYLIYFANLILCEKVPIFVTINKNKTPSKGGKQENFDFPSILFRYYII